MTTLPYKPKTTFKKAVFFDRDGTLNDIVTREDGTKGAPWNMKDFKIKPEALKACELLRYQGYGIFVVSNQPDLGKGLAWQTLRDMNSMLKNYLKVNDILAAPERGSSYYKPNNGMIEDLIEKYEVDRKCSWMVGDSEKDIIAGSKSELKTIFIGSLYKKELDFSIEPTYIKPDVWEAADEIVHRDFKGPKK